MTLVGSLQARREFAHGKEIQVKAVLQHQVGDEHLGDAGIRQGLGPGPGGQGRVGAGFLFLKAMLVVGITGLAGGGRRAGGRRFHRGGRGLGVGGAGAHPSFQMEAAARFCAMGVLLAEGLIGDNVYWRCR